MNGLRWNHQNWIDNSFKTKIQPHKSLSLACIFHINYWLYGEYVFMQSYIFDCLKHLSFDISNRRNQFKSTIEYGHFECENNIINFCLLPWISYIFFFSFMINKKREIIEKNKHKKMLISVVLFTFLGLLYRLSFNYSQIPKNTKDI